MPMLVDTDVLIWHLRGHASAARRLDQLPQLTISAVTWCELLQGMRSKDELNATKKMLVRRQAIILPLTEPITVDAIGLMEALSVGHGLQMADALIAAIARQHGLGLLTGNVKHFAPVDGLSIDAFAP